ncbi:MAG TPA: cytochrome P460 family protein [Reyranella sp.]
MKRLSSILALGGMIALAVLGDRTLSAADKDTVQVPGGLAMSEFKGYEDWAVVATSETNELIKVMVANPTMIAAYKSGIPLNGKPFPEGATIVKIEWTKKKNLEAPFDVKIPDTLKDVLFITKDSKRFAASAGWGYAQFNHDAASGSFTPEGSGSECGHACHTIVKAKDYIFTAYGKR